jgi:hypothetical protein
MPTIMLQLDEEFLYELRTVHQASLLGWQNFLTTVLKVGLEAFEAITGVTEREEAQDDDSR